MKIVIVDDEELIRLGLVKIVSKMDLGIEVIGSFGNGMEALTFMSKLQPEGLDVLITDIKMPTMDGLKLIEHVRAKMKSLHIIVLSGFNEFEYARSALRMGVTDYLLKPIDKSQLTKILRKLSTFDEPAVAPDEEEGENYVVDQIKTILDKEYDKPFELELLAERLGKSASYISRLFRMKTGSTITDYIIHVRIEKAKQFISDHPNLKNYEISPLVGYSDPVYFNKLFKKMTGMTPKEYRDKYH